MYLAGIAIKPFNGYNDKCLIYTLVNVKKFYSAEANPSLTYYRLKNVHTSEPSTVILPEPYTT